MARRTRAEVAGGLYHVITRGNNRQNIFHAPEDYLKFLRLLEHQKRRLPFFLYAYCLMTNHVHLLIERQADAVGRIMHRVLTGYSQYYNRRHRKVGHVLQGRHQAILCQSDRYLGELVRYIHLNPVRAKMVRKPENYPYSSHRSYLGLDPAGLVDVDPVLRHFAAKKQAAREHFRQFVIAGLKLGHQKEFYLADEGRILGDEEFVDSTIHRLGDTSRKRTGKNNELGEFQPEALLAAVDMICKVPPQAFFGSRKNARLVRIKEALLQVGTEAGASLKTLSDLTGMSSSTVSRRLNAAQTREAEIGELTAQIRNAYRKLHD